MTISSLTGLCFCDMVRPIMYFTAFLEKLLMWQIFTSSYLDLPLISPFDLTITTHSDICKKVCKIIFKWVNSTVGPIFNILSMWTVLWTVLLQWWTIVFVPCTVNPYEVTVHAQGKKKKWKTWTKETWTCRRSAQTPS